MRRRRPISSLARPESADGAGRGAAGAAESASEGRRMAASSAASSAASACSSSVADGVESRRTPSGPSAYLRRTAQHSHAHVAAAAPSAGPGTRHKARPSEGVMHRSCVCACMRRAECERRPQAGAGGHGRLINCAHVVSRAPGHRDGTGRYVGAENCACVVEQRVSIAGCSCAADRRSLPRGAPSPTLSPIYRPPRAAALCSARGIVRRVRDTARSACRGRAAAPGCGWPAR